MQADKTTINDLSIFSHEEEHSVFHHLDFTRTIGGKDWLRVFLSRPLNDLKKIIETQRILQGITKVLSQWPETITNGTVMVIEKFYETAIESIPHSSNAVNAASYKYLNGSDYSLLRYSVTHFIEFVKGLKQTADILSGENLALTLDLMIQRIHSVLNRDLLREMLEWPKEKKLAPHDVIHFGHYLRYHFKQEAIELIEIYSKLDAWYSLALAVEKHHYTFPSFIESDEPSIYAKQMYHPLLQTPVAYDVNLTQQQNFLFMTGANMAGKSTFIKAVGVSVYLAHIGMAVPAQEMRLTTFYGLLSNIQVVDNIVQGESYFFNEVQRIRKTIEKISDGQKWLILIDELFKGTNVQDAMKCSTVVIEGLRKMHNSLFILSTHLYEIGEALKKYPNIQFRYFETEVKNDQLLFSYQLKEGISNDRLGYLILKREGVVELLDKL
ncbi:MAG: MutS-related protein [Ilyomonas sp.]